MGALFREEEGPGPAISAVPPTGANPSLPGLTTSARSWFELLAQPTQGLKRLFGLRAYQNEASAGGEQRKLRKGILFTRDVR